MTDNLHPLLSIANKRERCRPADSQRYQFALLTNMLTSDRVSNAINSAPVVSSDYMAAHGRRTTFHSHYCVHVGQAECRDKKAGMLGNAISAKKLPDKHKPVVKRTIALRQLYSAESTWSDFSRST